LTLVVGHVSFVVVESALKSTQAPKPNSTANCLTSEEVSYIRLLLSVLIRFAIFLTETRVYLNFP